GAGRRRPHLARQGSPVASLQARGGADGRGGRLAGELPALLERQPRSSRRLPGRIAEGRSGRQPQLGGRSRSNMHESKIIAFRPSRKAPGGALPDASGHWFVTYWRFWKANMDRLAAY